jgi:hypothetical protein
MPWISVLDNTQPMGSWSWECTANILIEESKTWKDFTGLTVHSGIMNGSTEEPIGVTRTKQV